MHFLVMWNFAHTANAEMAVAITAPVICTPEELMGAEVMLKDEMVEEVRKSRQEQASRRNFGLKSIVADARKRQVQSGHNVVSFVPKGSKTV